MTIKITDTQVFGFQAALRDMRNPKESWHKSDSRFYDTAFRTSWEKHISVPELPNIGPNDLQLMKTLCWGGSEHRKFLRSIGIWAVIYPSRDIWQEIDTYKVATVRNSCSTMHKLGHRDLAESDFAFSDWTPADFEHLKELNALSREYRNTKSFEEVKKMKKRLPEGFIQRAGYHFSYETAFSMFLQRHNHRMDEWRWTGVAGYGTNMSLCDWIYGLPYMADLLEESIGSKRMKKSQVDALSSLLREEEGECAEQKLNEIRNLMKSFVTTL